MFPYNDMLVQAEVDYRRERIAADFGTARARRRLRKQARSQRRAERRQYQALPRIAAQSR